MNKWILAAFACLGVCGCVTSQEVAPTKPTPTAKSAVYDGKVTAEEYNLIKPGMLYSDVVFSISIGKELSVSKVGDVTTQVMEWKNPDGSSMSVTFQDGVLVQKSQSGIL